MFLSLIISSSAFALIQFDSASYELEGYLAVQEGKAFLVVNKGTDNETNFKLTGQSVSDLLTKDNHKVIAVIKVQKPVFGYTGEATFVRIKKYFSPLHKVKAYNFENELKTVK